MLPLAMPHRIFGDNSVDMHDIFSVEVVAIECTNKMIYCGQILTTQVSSFLCDYGGRGGISNMLVCLVIPGYHIIIIMFSSLLLVLSRGTSAALL